MVEVDMEKYRQMFLTEALELLEQANEDILKIEDAEDAELINAIFRNIHTIKGSAGGLGFDHITDFAHHMESALDSLRNGKIHTSPGLIDALLEANDALVEMVNAAKEGRDHTADPINIADALHSFMHNGDDEHVTADAPAAAVLEEEGGVTVPEDIRLALLANRKAGENTFRVEIRFGEDMLENGYDPLPILRNLQNGSSFYLAATEHSVPSAEDFDPIKLHLHPAAYVVTGMSASLVQDLSFDPDAIHVETVDLSEPKPQAAATGRIEVKAAPLEMIDFSAIDAGIYDEYIVSVNEYLDSLEPTMIAIEKGEEVHDTCINELFRVFHNIKGDSGYLGFAFMEKYAHTVESLLDSVRNGKVAFDKDMAELVLSVIGDIKRILTAGKEGKAVPVSPMYSEVIRIQERTKNLPAADADVAEVSIFLKQVEQFMEMIELARTEGGVDTQRMLRAIGGLGNAARFLKFTDLVQIVNACEEAVRTGKPIEDYLERINRYIAGLKSPVTRLGDLLVSEGLVEAEEIEEAAKKQKRIGQLLVEEGVLKEEQLEVVLKKQKVMQAVAKKEQAAAGAVAGAKQAEAELRTMKVDQVKIDKFTNTIGELVIAKNAFEYTVQKIAREYNLPSEVVKELKDNTYLISRVSQDLQRDILSLRMVPIRQVFSKFPRVVRDIARKQDKFIDLRVMGDETEIDKKVADVLSDPLIHMIRNACDHGIEAPEQRSAAGKHSEGTIILKAYQEGSFVYIEVIDDGKGIDPQKVLQKAVERGIVSPDDSLSKQEIINLIFEPGFSTAQAVTDVSGRGVGMDVVKTTISSLGGTVDVFSNMGEGSRVILKIPVTIGVSTALLVREAGALYALPIENITETINIQATAIKDLHYGRGIHYRNSVLPIYSLSALLSEPEPELAEEVDVVIVQSDMGKCGIIVDGLLNRMDIAIKPVPPYFGHLPYIGGVSILGDGQAVLVLNPGKLFL